MIYKQASLLVLDEATSALDQLQREGLTIVVIVHRLSTVQRCEQIFMLDDGRLVQSGGFSDLFGRLNRLALEGEL